MINNFQILQKTAFKNYIKTIFLVTKNSFKSIKNSKHSRISQYKYITSYQIDKYVRFCRKSY